MMMQKWIGAAALSAAVLAGCSKEEAPTPGSAAPSASTRPTSAGEQVKSVTSAATTEAQKLIDEAQGYLNDHKLDLADGTIKKLEDMKASLPGDYQAKISQLRQLFDAAKKAMGGMTIPKIGG